MAGEWRRFSLEDSMDAIIDYRGKTPRKTLSGIPLITAKVVKGGRIEAPSEFIDPSNYSDWMRRGLPKRGDVVLTTEAPLGEVAQLSGERVALAQRLICLRGKADLLNNTFLKFLLQSVDVQAQLRSRSSGTTVLGIKQSELRKVVLTFPPPPEQRAIAHILGTLDDKIELNRRRNATLEAMARALFKAWFVDFEPVRAKREGRWQRGQSLPGLPAHLYDLFPDHLVDSDLGEIPQDWDVCTLSDLVDVIKGRSYKSEELSDSDTALVTLKSFMRGGGYQAGGLKAFTGPYKTEQVVVPGDVVMACTDVTQHAAVIGRTALVGPDPKYSTLVASLDTLVLRPSPKGPLTRSFLYLLGRTEAFIDHMYAYTSGTTVLHLSRDALPSFPIAVPPLGLVQLFDQNVGPLLQAIASTALESRTLAALRDTLLPKLISGELRVQDAERFAGAMA